MNKSRSNVFIMLNLIVSFFISACSSPREQVKIENGTFNINGKDVQLICGEMHYPRIPHEYWRDRLHRARAMGLNTVSAYVFWNFHERQPGVFDFSGQADIAEFVRIAQEEGLYVILRPGPYVCAEWDFGGYPSWLLKEKDLTYRSKDPRFMSYCERYIKELGKQLAPLTINNGGNIIMVQVENEYGSYAADKEYLAAIRDMLQEAGFNVPLFTCDGGGQVEAGHIAGALPTLNGVSAKIYLKSWINIIRAVRTLWRSSIRLGLMNGGNVILLLPTSVLPNNWIGCWDMAYLSVCICSTAEQISGI